jgi:hypothetical protein
MSLTFPNSSYNNIDSMEFVGGSTQVITFSVYDSGSAVVNLNGSTAYLRIAPFGSATAIVTKTQSISSVTNQVTFTLASVDTASLAGKYTQQFSVVGISGSTINPSQGLLNILPVLS